MQGFGPGSRNAKLGTIFQRMKGFLKSGALSEADKPIWYDVWRAFPPAVPPSLDRKLPKEQVKEIFYPEDFVRAKYNQRYMRSFGSIELEKPFQEMKSEVFVKEYIKQQEPGQTVDRVIESTLWELQQRDLHFAKKGDEALSAKPFGTPSKAAVSKRKPKGPDPPPEVDFYDLFMDNDDNDHTTSDS